MSEPSGLDIIAEAFATRVHALQELVLLRGVDGTSFHTTASKVS